MFLKNKFAEKGEIRTIFAISFPIIVNSLVRQAQFLIDQAFLGNLDSRIFSAVGNVIFPYMTTTFCILAITTGTTVLVAQNLGAKNKEAARLSVESSIKFNTFLAFGIFLLWYIFPESIFQALGAEGPVLVYSVDFVRIICFSIIWLGVESSAVAALQGSGITKPIMYAGILRSGLNILFDWLLIYGNLGFPRMEVQGAALGTALSNGAAALVLILYVLKSEKLPFKIKIVNIIKARWKEYKKVITLGIPASIEQFLYSISNVILLVFMNALGPLVSGDYMMIFSISLTPFFFYLGIAQAATTLVGRKTGEQNEDGAIRMGKICASFSVMINIFWAVLFLVFPHFFLQIFTKDAAMIERAVPLLTLMTIAFFPKGINVVAGSSIRGYGDTKWMLATQSVGIVFVVLCAYILMFPMGLKLAGLFIAILLDELIRSLLNSYRFLKGFRLSPGRKALTSES